ncbi:hypothetical protein [Streptomyces sp. NPDC005799]|uniref:hypothetical protein n=1 Tax=Streptomyces sp. NPDC005799 TaxID=3154678 RepID=UPI0033D98CEF
MNVRLDVLRAARLAASTVAVVLAATGCGFGHHDSTSADNTARVVKASPAAVSPDATRDPYAASVDKPPKLASDGITALVSGSHLKGSVIYPIPGRVRAGEALVIAVNCQGPGRLDAEVRAVGMSFSLPCEKDTVLPALNEFQMDSSHSLGSLRFTAKPDVMWSFTVGLDRHPPKPR